MATPTRAPAENPGTHHLFIKEKIPPWLSNTSLPRVAALTSLNPERAGHHKEPTTAQRSALKQALGAHWTAQNALDKKLGHLNDIRAFAEPLLKKALKAYGDIDVRQTFLRLYAPADLPWWVVEGKSGVKSRTVSLLDAALHNFSASETISDYAFLSAADKSGQQDILTFIHGQTHEKLTADTFKKLCRTLDIGARYQQQVRATLGFDDAHLAASLRHKVITQQKAALNSAAHLALINHHIAADAYAFIQRLLRDAPGLRLGGLTLQLHTLDILETRLMGVLVIAPQDALPFGDGRVLVYIPDDPEHPLKEYPAFGAFATEFAQRLRATADPDDTVPGSYPQFISQFIAHDQRGRFLAVLKQRLYEWRREPRPAVEGPTWTQKPVDAPNLQWRLQAVEDDTQSRSCTPVCDDIWQYLYRVKFNKIVNDSREIAISTAYADRMARWAWWDNLEKMLSDVFNAALLVATPFVPVLGELMLAYTAYQLANDVFEGIVDWAQGNRIEAQEHLLSAVQNVVQGLLFERGGKIVEVAKVKLSAFVDGLKPVVLANGETRLWNPDPTPYQHQNLELPADVTPDEAGRHHHQGKQIVQVEDQQYQIEQDRITDEHYLVHPERADAYRPQARLNGSGACVLEHETPRSWDDARLMRRLGPQTRGLSDSELEQIRVISAVDHGAVRHMYVNNEPAPPLLTDTLNRFKSAKRLKADIDNIRNGRPLDPASYWFEQMVTELKGWPKDKALQVYLNADRTGVVHRYGSRSAQGDDVLSLSTGEVMSGQLPEKVLAFLDQPQIDTLLGGSVSSEQQPQALRDRLASYVELHTEAVIQNMDWKQQLTNDPDVLLLRTQYPDLPLSIARQLLRHARQRELKVMSDEKRLPLEVKNNLREVDFEVTTTHLFEQLHHDLTLSPKAERLILNTLLLYSDAMAGLRIEVREGTLFNDVRSATGVSDAPTVRVLVRDKNAQYRVFDLEGNKLHGPSDFYTATLRCLPSAASFSDAASLRRWVIDKAVEPATRREVLADPPIPQQAATETVTLLRGGFMSRLGSAGPAESTFESLQRRIKTVLPDMTGEGARRFARASQTAEGRQVLEAIETEGKALSKALDTYVRARSRWPKGSRLEAVTRRQRTAYADKLLETWRAGYTRQHDPFSARRGAVHLRLSELPRPDSLPDLPVPLKHVTRLYMNDCDFSSDRTSFLKHFPNLLRLHLEGNLLETLPPAITQMRSLEELNLSNNRIVLDADAVSRLRTMSRLRRVTLADNPLGLPPDISLMPDLHILQLGNTRISEWPVGLFAQARDENFILELHGNPITHLPDVPMGSEHAEVIALTRLDRTRLSADYRDLFEVYRESVGLDPMRTYEPMGDSDFWVEDLGETTGNVYRTHWDDLENEPGSQGFFEVIHALEPPDFFQDPADLLAYENNLTYLRTQVRTMLSTMVEDAELRQKLFTIANFPGLCPDAGRQIFNQMGIEVEVTRARRYSRNLAEREARLVRLARGGARLKLLNNVARADIAHRIKPTEEGGLGLRFNSQMEGGVPGTVDEVEVYLAYQTRLARQLDLPWVSEYMLYRDTANVDDASIKQAHDAVLELSEGDGLVDQMLLEPYWESFLKERYAEEYAQKGQDIDERFLLLDQLQSKQLAFSQAQHLGEAALADKHASLKTLADQLDLPQEQVLNGQPMSDELYNRVLNRLGDQRQQWLREKTHASLGVIDHAA
ncbi:DUF6543 domain-containing protein [Pseudomonas sp.]|uniref:dermonecrotic toxin domain-containing protein n=1 Tax=Pseudomonas sp. TaxID=306 RepID=UPI00261178AC|nr:DUF6543 domain-containing protein [Pseudomonas sp.]